MSKSNTSSPKTGGSGNGSSKTSSAGQNPNYPSTTGNPSGPDRGNTPKK